jgi:hypothetical protein
VGREEAERIEHGEEERIVEGENWRMSKEISRLHVNYPPYFDPAGLLGSL